MSRELEWTALLTSKFPLGLVLMTPGAEEQVGLRRLFVCLARHSQGDWGALDEHDRLENERCLKDGNRLLSKYPINPDKSAGLDNAFYIITEHDRSATTVLLPSEY